MSIISKMKQFWTWLVAKKRRYLGALLIIVIVLFALFGKGNQTANAIIDTVKKVDLKQTVLATGQVTSETDLGLSFNTSGTVRALSVKVGDVVATGQLLATLNNADELARLTSARGAYLSAQAKYQKVLEGASSEEVAVAQVALDNAKIDLTNITNAQNTLVTNAYRTLLNTGLAAISSTNIETAPTISGLYTGTDQGTITLSTYSTGSGGYFTTNGLVTGGGSVGTNATAIGTSGLFVSFPSGFLVNSGATWSITIPNTQATGYVTAYNAYNQSLQTKESAIATAKAIVDARTADLNLKKAAARPVELDAAQADIVSAEGTMQTAQAAYQNTVLVAPASGTITKVDTKIGELAQTQKEVIVLQDVSHLYLEAKINEANITKVVLGQDVSFTIDAFGPDRIFTGKVVHIDPSATTEDGVVNYKINISIPEEEKQIRPGMNADMTILISDNPNVLAVPLLAITNKDAKTFLTVVTDKKGKKTTEREVTIGAVGDGNLVQIISGVTEGERIKIISK